MGGLTEQYCLISPALWLAGNSFHTNVFASLHLTHWGRVTHICVAKLAIIGSDNGLSHGRHQGIIWTIAGILLIGPLRTNFSEILIGIQLFSFKKMHLKTSSAKWRPFVSASMLSYINAISWPLPHKVLTYMVPSNIHEWLVWWTGSHSLSEETGFMGKYVRDWNLYILVHKPTFEPGDLGSIRGAGLVLIGGAPLMSMV